jgi:hypothetical protein
VTTEHWLAEPMPTCIVKAHATAEVDGDNPFWVAWLAQHLRERAVCDVW